MSLTLSQIITDAKRLASRLKERDMAADVLLNETQVINKKIDAMKQLQEQVEDLNEVAHQKPHSELISNIQKENMREIQRENRELRAALEDYHITLEHIMSKYREHTSQQIYKTRINFKALQETKYSEIIMNQADKIQEMAAIMDKAATIDEERDLRDQEKMAMLITENQGLRELLETTCSHGNFLAKADKIVQTDNELTDEHSK